MKRCSVLIPDGEGGSVAAIVLSLAQVGQYDIHVASTSVFSEIRFSRYCTSFHCRDSTMDQYQWLGWCLDLLQRTDSDILLPISETAAFLAVTHWEKLQSRCAVVPLPPLGKRDIVGDKWLFAQFLTHHAIPHPVTRLCTLDDVFSSDLNDQPFPILLKPRVGAGGIGIRRFEDRDTLRRHMENNPDLSGACIIQQYIQGMCLGSSFLALHGHILGSTVQINLSSKQDYGPPFVVKFVHDKRVTDIAERISSAFEWSGVANIDFIRNGKDGQIHVLELNPRFWYTMLGSTAVGVNIPYLACLAAQGMPCSPPEYSNRLFTMGSIEWLKQTLQWLPRQVLARDGVIPSAKWQFYVKDPLPVIMLWIAKLLHRLPLKPRKWLRSRVQANMSP